MLPTGSHFPVPPANQLFTTGIPGLSIGNLACCELLRKGYDVQCFPDLFNS